MKISKGDTLTLKHEIFKESGLIIFNPGDKVKISKVLIKEEFWGKGSGQFYPEEITGVQIVGHRGDWSLEIFEETSK